MTSTQPVPLPYGIRDVKLTVYTDGSGTNLGTTSVDLPNVQTLSFSESEEFATLQGDDKTVATRGKGSTVDWSLEAGGLSYAAWAILTGNVIVETGTNPNRKTTLRKFATASRPYFRAEGQAISDSGGDLHTVLYRCKTNGSVEGTFGQGEFFVTKASGVALPLVNTSVFDLLYEFVQNETAVTVPTTPVANPTA